MLSAYPVIIKGGGDIGSGVAYRLHRSGFPVIITELPQPLVIRRSVAFAEAVRSNTVEVEGVRAVKANHIDQLQSLWGQGAIPVVVDPGAIIVRDIKPVVLIDAVLAKHNTGTKITDAPVVVALGPGFEAGIDAHAVIETNRGHRLGKVVLQGSAEPNTGIPTSVEGYTDERLIRSPRDGVLSTLKEIGESVVSGEIICYVDDIPIYTRVSGVVRGLLADSSTVKKNLKIGDIDPRGERNSCFTISDKALAIAGGVLEAILYWMSRTDL